jgi:hypothetical protein
MEATKNKNEYGLMVINQPTIKFSFIADDIQPISQDRAKKEYGVDKIAKFLIFSGLNNININDKVKISDSFYLVSGLKVWDDHLEIVIGDEDV